MARHRLAAAARSVFILLAFTALIALPPSAMADETDSPDIERNLFALIEGQDVSTSADMPLSTQAEVISTAREANSYMSKNKHKKTLC